MGGTRWNVIIFVIQFQYVNTVKITYIVSDVFYKAKRQVTDGYVIGYLVKNKNGEVQGILNKDSGFYELAFINESTIEIYKE